MVFEAPELDDQEIEVLAKIAELRANLRLRLQSSNGVYSALERLQRARTLRASSAIDGVIVALDDVVAIGLRESPIDAGETTSSLLRGYRDATKYVALLADDVDFEYSSQTIKALHYCMGSYEEKFRPGRWRLDSTSIVRDAAGANIYVGPDTSEVATLMRELTASLRAHDGPPTLIRAAMVHLNVITIRPFERGNGRLARSLETLVLARHGALSPWWCGVDEHLARNADSYRAVLADVGGRTWPPSRDTRPWIRYMLTAHLRQSQTVKRRVSESELLWERLEKLVASRDLASRTMVALYDGAAGLRVRSATYRAAQNESFDEGITEATASRDLRQLAESGLIAPVGEKRGRHYVATPELRSLHEEITSNRKKKDRSEPFARLDVKR